jgi:hypothetical protein
MTMLQYLDFDFSEDEHGLGSFDAMASVLPAQVPALHAELTRVLAWACDAFRKGPLDEGSDWDYDLQLAEDSAAQGHIGFDESSSRLRVDVHPGVTPASRHTVTLTVSGTPVFCMAFREAFGLGA